MNKLPSDFELDKYGLHVRLVREEDAEFILVLRTNPVLSKYLHPVDNDIEKQRQWIRNYKVRELHGEDYYFIFFDGQKPIGLIRIYDIDYDASKATVGSWICQQGLPMEQPILVLTICREILFENINAKEDVFDVRKLNKKVLQFHQMMGAEIKSQDEDNYYLTLSKESFVTSKKQILHIFNYA